MVRLEGRNRQSLPFSFSNFLLLCFLQVCFLPHPTAPALSHSSWLTDLMRLALTQGTSDFNQEVDNIL